MNTVVLYHKNCPDGFGAAWAAHKRYPNAEYIPVAYGEPVPSMPTDGALKIILVDFSFDAPTMSRLAQQHHVEVYDHHKTAQQALTGLKADRVVFDMERSGAGITWDELMGSPRPALISYVEDRDLWRWALPFSREISAYMMSYMYTFADWNHIDSMLTTGNSSHSAFMEAVGQGAAILRSKVKDTSMICDQAAYAVGDFLRTLPDSPIIVNATSLWSEVGEELLKRYADVKYAVSWFVRKDNVIQVSLRSRGDYDVTAVAKLYGGGGHAAAAGFTIPQ